MDTAYTPCACSPIGKLKRLSQPYAPGGTVYWTTYSYDCLGRTTQVDLPGGSGSTATVYQGNTTTVTDPAGESKIAPPALSWRAPSPRSELPS